MAGRHEMPKSGVIMDVVTPKQSGAAAHVTGVWFVDGALARAEG
jgi:pyridoxal biosynthesis lyase PdxS